MNMPGFTAETSLWETHWGYQSADNFVHTSNAVTLQACDPICTDLCGDPSDCSDLPTPAQRAACVARVRRCLRGCCPPTCGPCTPGPCNPDCSRQPSSRVCRNTVTGGTFTEPC